MNDRLKFRVWNPDGKYYDDDPQYNVCIQIDQISGLVLAPFHNNIIEMCTGLKDKNGNLIYEGDILLCDRKIVDCGTGEEIHYKKSGVVQRDKNGQYFINGKDWYGSDITFYNECAEIIGNIHEQAEQKDK